MKAFALSLKKPYTAEIAEKNSAEIAEKTWHSNLLAHRLRYGLAEAGIAGELRRFVRRLPGEVRIAAPEVPVRGGLLVNRTTQIERVDDAARRQLEVRTNPTRNRSLTVAAPALPAGSDRSRDRQGAISPR